MQKTKMTLGEVVIMKKLILILGFIALLSSFALPALATPVGPLSIINGTSSRATLDQTVKNVPAQAGNVSEINITTTSITQSWQGYYGSITASLVLADSSNNQFYNWSIAAPSGEVYASPNSSITWANIHCFNYSGNGSGEINLTLLDAQYGMTSTDVDALNNTYNLTNHPAFAVGTVSFTANKCPSTYVFNETGYQVHQFSNVLLSDGGSIVFTGILENNLRAFNNVSEDFQMLVAEDGHGSASSTLTTYYFWVEVS
jgi:hypothetical protein